MIVTKIGIPSRRISISIAACWIAVSGKSSVRRMPLSTRVCTLYTSAINSIFGVVIIRYQTWATLSPVTIVSVFETIVNLEQLIQVIRYLVHRSNKILECIRLIAVMHNVRVHQLGIVHPLRYRTQPRLVSNIRAQVEGI